MWCVPFPLTHWFLRGTGKQSIALKSFDMGVKVGLSVYTGSSRLTPEKIA